MSGDTAVDAGVESGRYINTEGLIKKLRVNEPCTVLVPMSDEIISPGQKIKVLLLDRHASSINMFL